MRKLIWTVFALAAVLWTALAWAAAEVIRWLSRTLSSEALAAGGQHVGEWSVPAWLAAWIGPQPGEVLAGALQWVMQASTALLPAAGTATGWLVPLAWIVWALGAVVLIAMAVGAQRLGTHAHRAVAWARLRSAGGV